MSTNDTLIDTASKSTRPVCITVTHTTSLDKALAKRLNKKPLQYYLSAKPIFSANRSYNIYGDYVITIKMDPKIETLIDKWYERHAVFNEEAKSELRNIILMKGYTTVIVRKNAPAARKIKKVLGNYFVIKNA
jgi:hypothetical protein